MERDGRALALHGYSYFGAAFRPEVPTTGWTFEKPLRRRLYFFSA